jgi:hypothetical protein
MKRMTVLVLTSLAASAACFDDDERVSITAPPVAPPNGAVAYIAVSDVAPAPGSTIVAVARVRTGADLRTVGSFTARLTYDATGLTFLEEVKLPAGMRAINASEAGTVRAAGAAAEGLADGSLFAVAFRVANPAALESLALSVDELTSTTFDDNLRNLAKHRRLVRDAVAASLRKSDRR